MLGSIREVLNTVVKAGWPAYIVDSDKYGDGFAYIITPSDNVLCICKGEFGGLRVTFEYHPSRETGTGCSCYDGDMRVSYVANIDNLLSLEADGKAFARRLNAKLYRSSDTWLENNYWYKKDMLKPYKIVEEATV